jgi:hypothetical protein
MAQADSVPTPTREPNPDAGTPQSTNLRPIRTKPRDRRYFIGGSDARVIMGADEAALLRLWREKRGEIEPEDLSGNLVVQLGVATEDLNRRWYKANSGQVLTDVQRRIRHPVLRWMAATLDGRVQALRFRGAIRLLDKLPVCRQNRDQKRRAGGVDKSILTLPMPRRIRDRDHVKLIAKQPCLVCGRRPTDAHHLPFAQSPALGRKVSDEFTVPLCRGHHREVHRCGDEAAWWQRTGIDPAAAARVLWLKTHPLLAAIGQAPSKLQNEADLEASLAMTSFRQIEAPQCTQEYGAKGFW